MRRRRLHMYTTTLGDPGETSGPRIDRIPPTRPQWWHRQYRDIKKLIFSAPSKCPIDLFGLLAYSTILNDCMPSLCWLVSYMPLAGSTKTL